MVAHRPMDFGEDNHENNFILQELFGQGNQEF